MLEHLQKVPALRPTPDDETWLEDVIVEFRQALGICRLSSDVLRQRKDAFASIISNNLNVVMMRPTKFLASVMVVLTLPLLVSSFSGMNVALPGEHSPSAFIGLLALSAVACTVVALLLRRRPWL